MPDPVAPAAQPVMMTDTYVEIGGANLRCLATNVSVEPELSPITLTTFCGVKDYPGPVKWHFKVTLAQSFDVGATDEILAKALADYQADGTLADFKVRAYTARPISATNPSIEGHAIPQEYVIFGGDAGAASTVEVDWVLDSPPVRVTTPPPANGG
jgi:hypothetical protein